MIKMIEGLSEANEICPKLFAKVFKDESLAWKVLEASLAYAELQKGEISQNMQLAGLQAFVDKAVSERPENFKHLTDEDIDEKSFDYGFQMGRELMNSGFTDAVFKAMLGAVE